MPAFAIVATIEVPAEHLSAFEAALLAHRDRCRRDEPGTVQFDVLRPNDEPPRFMLYEVYVDEAAFDAHWNGASLARMRQETDGIEMQLSGIRCTRPD